jgi:hypothetical protein
MGEIRPKDAGTCTRWSLKISRRRCVGGRSRQRSGARDKGRVLLGQGLNAGRKETGGIQSGAEKVDGVGGLRS